MSVELLTKELILYVKERNVWITACSAEFESFLQKTQALFATVNSIHNKNQDIALYPLYAAATFMFMWKYNCFDEDAELENFRLNFQIVLCMMLPHILQRDELQHAEILVCRVMFNSTYEFPQQPIHKQSTKRKSPQTATVITLC